MSLANGPEARAASLIGNMLAAAEQLGLDDHQIAALNRVYWASSSGRSGADLVREAASLLSPDQFREAVARFASEVAPEQGVPTGSRITNLEAAITAEINGRLKDRSVVEIELASSVAERLVGWSKTFGLFVAAPAGILLLIIGLFGFSKFEDVRNAANRVDVVVREATVRLDEGNTKLQQADRRVTEITEQALQRAQNVDRQLATLREATEKAQTQISSLGQSVQQIETRLGGLSARYETGNRGPGTVTSGAGDAGGKGYGTYSLSTLTGSVRRFLDRPEFPWRDAFAGMEPGSPEFDAAWRALAEREPDRFGEEQRKYIQDIFFEPAVRNLKEACGLDVKTRSKVLQDVIWSRAVQTGPRIGRVVRVCQSLLGAGRLDPSDKTLDERLIREIYGGAISNVENDFSANTSEIRKQVRERLEQERELALKQLATEGAR